MIDAARLAIEIAPGRPAGRKARLRGLGFGIRTSRGALRCQQRHCTPFRFESAQADFAAA